MTQPPRPSGLAPNAVWPSRVLPRPRAVLVTHGVTLTRDLIAAPSQGRPLQRVHPDVRSGLVDPDVGLVPPPPDNSHAAPAPDTLDVRPATQAAGMPPAKKAAARPGKGKAR